MAASTVTGTTSIVLVSSIGTIVYLSSVGYPGHIVTIKDYAGVASQGSPIIVSTSKDLLFADGSISTLLFDPFSYLTVSSKTPTTWQVLNNVGFFTTLSNAFVQQLTTTNAYTGITSSVTEYVSSSVIGRVNVTKELTLTGNVDILGNVTVTGVVDLLSTMDTRDTVSISSSLTVNGPVAFGSTVTVKDDMTVGGYISTLNNIFVGQGLRVDKSLYVEASLVPRFLSVQTLKMDSMNVGGAFQVNESMSIGSNLFLGGSLTGLSSLCLQSSFQILGETFVQDSLQIQSNVFTNSLTSFSSGYVTEEVSAKSLVALGTLSTANSLFVNGLLQTGGDTIVSSVIVNGEVTTNSLVVNGNAEISSIVTTGEFFVEGGVVSFYSSFYTASLNANSATIKQSLNVQGVTSVSTNASTHTNLYSGGNLEIAQLNANGNAQVYFDLIANEVDISGNLSTGVLFVNQDLNVGGDLSIPGTVTVGTLGASIEISISTLTLSNAFSVSNVANIPNFESTSNRFNTFPQQVVAGVGTRDFGPNLFLNAQPEANIRDTLRDLTGSNDKKIISSIRVSTLYNTDILSTFVIGSSDYLNPLVDISGYLLLGSASNFKLLLGSFNVFSGNLPTSTNGAYYNPIATSNQVQWVTVGRSVTQQNTIQYSSNYGRSWNPVATGGFANLPFGPGFPPYAGIGNDVVYMSTTLNNQGTPKWVATGYGFTGGVSIQWSPDGINWAPGAGSIFNATLYGNKLLYYPSPAEQGICLAGGYGGPGDFGIRWSGNGINWFTTTTNAGPTEFICRDFTIGPNNGNLAAIGHTTGNANRIYFAAPMGYQSGWSNLSNNITTTGTFNTISYGKGFYLVGTSATSSNPLTSIWKATASGAGISGLWAPASSGGFSGGTNKITFDTTLGIFVAVGSNAVGRNVQYSVEGSFWFPVENTFTTSLSSIAGGIMPLPDNNSRYFTANVETRFQTVLSTIELTASTLQASSVQAAYFIGDASRVTNLTTFSDKMGTSSIVAQSLILKSTIQTQASSFFGSAEISTGSLATTSFFSTVNIWLGAGIDSLPNGNIQQSRNVSNWVRASNANFQFYGNAITGNSNQFFPHFIATGADSDPAKTIQYSIDGFTWTPANTGGFPTQSFDSGVYVGNTAATTYYLSTIDTPPFYVLAGPRYLVGGDAFGTASTLFYSDDGSNFAAATGTSNCLADRILKIKYNNTFSLATNSNFVLINSSNSIDWNPTSLDAVQAFAFGTTPEFGSAWYAIRGGTVWTSYDTAGSNWFLTSLFNPSLQNVLDMAYNGQYFAAITSNQFFLMSSINAGWYAAPEINDFGPFINNLTTLFWEPTQARWFLGARAQSSINTLLTSPNGLSWSNMVAGGFSSGITTYGVGYAALFASSVTMLGGIGIYNGSVQPASAQILQGNSMIFPPAPSGGQTLPLLGQQYASNVFSTTVYGLAFTSSLSQTYHYVAVGDGQTPQRTIARTSYVFSNNYNSLDFGPWLPAVTGGFSPAGYGAIYYSTQDIWLAVGKAAASTATIQYSADTANWFATNFSGSLSLGGRGIAKFITDSPYPNRLVAVGEAPFVQSGDLKTILYSDDGFTWLNPNSDNGFYGAGYGVAAGFIAGRGNGMVAVGASLTASQNPDQRQSILWSTDGERWDMVTSGGFKVAGYGVAYGKDYLGNDVWVAVGDNGGEGGVKPQMTIQYSSDAVNWNPVNSGNGFAFAGYGVTYNDASGVFIAVGKGENQEGSVLYSGDGFYWATLQGNTGGFQSQKTNGATFGLYAQQITTSESFPFLQMPQFLVYERDTPQTYNIPSVRLQTEFSSIYIFTDLVLNETLTIPYPTFVNVSTPVYQIAINTDIPFGSNTLTVEGDIQTSSLVYTGSQPRYENMVVSSFVVSTLQIQNQLLGESLLTPSWGFGYSNVSSLANYFAISEFLETVDLQSNYYSLFNINDTLFCKQRQNDNTNVYVVPTYGINTSNPQVELDVSGTAAISSLITGQYTKNTLVFSEPNQTYITSPIFSISEKPGALFPDNVIQSGPSSITFNSMMTLNFSTNRVGLYAKNPQYDLDVQRAARITTLETKTINTGTLFLTLQSS
jgi:hypothetical protein